MVEVRFGRDRVGQDQESVSEGQYMVNELKIKTEDEMLLIVSVSLSLPSIFLHR